MKIDIKSHTSVYEQIKDAVKADIATGKLGADDMLPSVKKLGDELGVNFNTTAKAYRELALLGIVYARRGVGVFVNGDAVAKTTRDHQRAVTARLKEAVRNAMDAGVLKSERMKCLMG